MKCLYLLLTYILPDTASSTARSSQEMRYLEIGIEYGTTFTNIDAINKVPELIPIQSLKERI